MEQTRLSGKRLKVLTYVNLTDASLKRKFVIIAKECCAKGAPSLAGRTPFRNLRKLDWCEGRLLGTVKRRPPIPTVFQIRRPRLAEWGSLDRYQGVRLSSVWPLD